MPNALTDHSKTIHLTDDAMTLVHVMAERTGLSAERVLDIAVKEKAGRDGAMDELQNREDEKEALLRLKDTKEPNVPWSQVKAGAKK
jgi:hypothetical protein